MSQSHWRQQKQKIINTLTGIIEGCDYSEENDKIDRVIARSMKIKNFYGRDSEELKYNKDFELNCIVLGKDYAKPVKECTVREYFALIKYNSKRNG